MPRMRTQDAALHLAASVTILFPAWLADGHRGSQDPLSSLLGPLLDVVPFSVLAGIVGAFSILPAWVLLDGVAEWLGRWMVRAEMRKLDRALARLQPGHGGQNDGEHARTELASRRGEVIDRERKPLLEALECERDAAERFIAAVKSECDAAERARARREDDVLSSAVVLTAQDRGDSPVAGSEGETGQNGHTSDSSEGGEGHGGGFGGAGSSGEW